MQPRKLAKNRSSILPTLRKELTNISNINPEEHNFTKEVVVVFEEMILKKVKLRQITVVEALSLRVRQSTYALEKAFQHR